LLSWRLAQVRARYSSGLVQRIPENCCRHAAFQRAKASCITPKHESLSLPWLPSAQHFIFTQMAESTTLMLLFYFWRWHKVELLILPENLITQARKRNTLLLVLLALLGLLQ